MAFLGGVVAGVTAMFLWIAAVIGPPRERERRRALVYEVRKDDWNRYWSDL